MSKTIKVFHDNTLFGVIVEFDVIIDDIDFDLLSSHQLFIQMGETRVKRVMIRVKDGRLIPLSWFLCGIPSEGVIDHIDRNPLNNKRNNYRNLTHAQNAQNRKLRVDSVTGYLGVNKLSDRGKYRAIYRPNGRRFQAEFDSAKEAAVQYDKFVRLYSELPDAPTNESLGLIKPEQQIY